MNLMSTHNIQFHDKKKELLREFPRESKTSSKNKVLYMRGGGGGGRLKPINSQADLSLRCTHMPFCWCCHALAQIQYNPNGSNKDGSFTVDDMNSFFSPYKILPIALENKYLGIFFSYFMMELYVVCTH